MKSEKNNKVSKFLFLVVGYNNAPEILEFAKQIDCLDRAEELDVEIVVTLNAGSVSDYSCLQNIQTSIVVLDAKSNIGYLEGCNFGLIDYKRRHGAPDWVCISNSDLILGKNFYRLVCTNSEGADASGQPCYPAESIGQISPMVVLESGRVQNPHLLVRPTRVAVLRTLFIHHFSVVGAVYIWLSILRGQLSRNWTKSDSNSDELSDPHCIIGMYAAHGSCFILSSSFFKMGGTLSGAPHLYFEEIFVGEQVRRLGLLSICDTSIRVVHMAHSTTKYLSLRRVSGKTKLANRAIYDRWFKP